MSPKPDLKKRNLPYSLSILGNVELYGHYCPEVSTKKAFLELNLVFQSISTNEQFVWYRIPHLFGKNISSLHNYKVIDEAPYSKSLNYNPETDFPSVELIEEEYTVYKDYGNLVSAALPSAFITAVEKKDLPDNSKVLLTAFGSGLNCIFSGLSW